MCRGTRLESLSLRAIRSIPSSIVEYISSTLPLTAALKRTSSHRLGYSSSGFFTSSIWSAGCKEKMLAIDSIPCQDEGLVGLVPGLGDRYLKFLCFEIKDLD